MLLIWHKHHQHTTTIHVSQTTIHVSQQISSASLNIAISVSHIDHNTELQSYLDKSLVHYEY